MKKITNKRWLAVISVVLVMVLTTATLAVSGFKGHFGRHGGDHAKEKVLSHVDYTVQELKLTSDQQVKYTAIRDKMGKAIDECVARHQAAKDKFHAEMKKPNPDLRMVAGNIRNEVNAVPDVVNTQIDYLLEIYGILDAQQQRRLAAMLKEHMDRHDCS